MISSKDLKIKQLVLSGKNIDYLNKLSGDAQNNLNFMQDLILYNHECFNYLSDKIKNDRVSVFKLFKLSYNIRNHFSRELLNDTIFVRSAVRHYPKYAPELLELTKNNNLDWCKNFDPYTILTITNLDILKYIDKHEAERIANKPQIMIPAIFHHNKTMGKMGQSFADVKQKILDNCKIDWMLEYFKNSGDNFNELEFVNLCLSNGVEPTKFASWTDYKSNPQMSKLLAKYDHQFYPYPTLDEYSKNPNLLSEAIKEYKNYLKTLPNLTNECFSEFLNFKTNLINGKIYDLIHMLPATEHSETFSRKNLFKQMSYEQILDLHTQFVDNIDDVSLLQMLSTDIGLEVIYDRLINMIKGVPDPTGISDDFTETISHNYTEYTHRSVCVSPPSFWGGRGSFVTESIPHEFSSSQTLTSREIYFAHHFAKLKLQKALNQLYGDENVTWADKEQKTLTFLCDLYRYYKINDKEMPKSLEMAIENALVTRINENSKHVFDDRKIVWTDKEHKIATPDGIKSLLTTKDEKQFEILKQLIQNLPKKKFEERQFEDYITALRLDGLCPTIDTYKEFILEKNNYNHYSLVSDDTEFRIVEMLKLINPELYGSIELYDKNGKPRDNDELLSEQQVIWLEEYGSKYNNPNILYEMTGDIQYYVSSKKYKNPNGTKNHHSKFAPSSQGVKSRKPIEDDFNLTM